MALCPLNKKIYDPIRRCFVSATKEEYVRQKLIYRMINELGYPKSLLVVEKKLRDLPQLKVEKKDIPNRRVDLLCFDLGLRTPLLLVECKAQFLSTRGMTQILGYNAFIHAKAICLAYPNGLWLILGKEKEFRLKLPSFDELRKLS